MPQYLEEVGYIKSNWLDPYKKKLVKAWVDQHPHLGNVVASRVEGSFCYGMVHLLACKPLWLGDVASKFASLLSSSAKANFGLSNHHKYVLSHKSRWRYILGTA